MPTSTDPAVTATRSRLEAIVERYLDALVANDPSALPTTDGVLFSENDQVLELGAGCWTTITGTGTYRHLYADTRGDRVGFMGTLRENGVPVIYDLCLYLAGEQIEMIESLIIRDPVGASRLERMGAPEPVWLEPVPPAERLSREELAATAGRYLAGMENNDGRGDYSFFDRECDRIEHGLQTTNVKTGDAYGHSHDTDFASMTAEEQWQTGFLGFVTEIRSRRILIVDEERQVVLLAATLDHNGTIRELEMTTGRTFVIPPYFDVPRTLQVMEAFRVRNGKLYRIEMTLTEVPYGTRPPAAGADGRRLIDGRAEPPAGSGRAGDPATAVRAVLDALRTHDASALPLAPTARYNENGQHLAIGDGLWRTLSGAAPDVAAPQYRVEAVEASAQQAVWVGGIVEHTTPGMLALRVRLAEGLLTEIEAVAVRQEETGERSGTVTLFQPRPLTPFDPAGFADVPPALLADVPAGERLPPNAAVGLVEAYLDGIERDDSTAIPFSPDCRRRQNGHWTSNDPDAAPLDPDVPGYRPFALGCAELIDSGFFGPVARIRERRHLVDEARGLVVSVAAVDRPGGRTAIEVPGLGRVALPGPRALAQAGEPESDDVLFAARGEANLLVPVTDLVVVLTKVRAGRIGWLECLARGGPFGMSTGWAG
jgi:hypothetical protein